MKQLISSTKDLQVRLLAALRSALYVKRFSGESSLYVNDKFLASCLNLYPSSFSRISTGVVQASPEVLRKLLYLTSAHVGYDFCAQLIKEWVESLPDSLPLEHKAKLMDALFENV